MGIFGGNFGQRLFNGINAMTQRWGEMNGDEGALLRLKGSLDIGQLSREIALAQWQQQNPDAMALTQNVGASGHQPGSPDYQQLIANGVMAPRMLMWGDPSTGGYAIPYGGSAGMPMASQPSAGPVSKVIGGKTYYQINGDWYDNPEGR